MTDLGLQLSHVIWAQMSMIDIHKPYILQDAIHNPNGPIEGPSLVKRIERFLFVVVVFFTK